jgi:hypothetical protein
MRRHRTDQTTCSSCRTNPPRSGGRWCHGCHAADQAARRARAREELAQLRAAVSQIQARPILDAAQTA